MLDPIPSNLLPKALAKIPDFVEGTVIDLLGLGASSLLLYGLFYDPSRHSGHFSIDPYRNASVQDLIQHHAPVTSPKLNRTGETRSHIEYSARLNSPYVPFHPQWAPYYYAQRENHELNIVVMEPKAGDPTLGVLFLHGWSMSHLDEVKAMEPWTFFEGERTRLVLMELPYHMDRKPHASTFSGEYFVSGDLPRTVEAIAQAVSETISLLAWMKNDIPAAGLLGGSLGGYVSSLTLTQTNLADFGVLLYPATSLNVLMENPVMGYWSQKGLEHAGYTLEDALALGQKLSPLSYPCKLPPERLIMLAGLADQVIPPKHALALQAHFGGPDLHWYPGGHAGVLMPRYRRWMAKHIRQFLSREGFLYAT